MNYFKEKIKYHMPHGVLSLYRKLRYKDIPLSKNIKTRLGCKELENYASFNYSNGNFLFGFCCPRPGQVNTPKVIFETNDPKQMAQLFKTGRDKLISTLDSKNHPCHGCNKISNVSDTALKPLTTIQISLPLSCNMLCFYCHNSIPKRTNAQIEEKKKLDSFDYISLFKEFEKLGMIDNKTKFNWASGEITILKQRHAFFDFAKTHNVHIFCNGLLFSKDLADWFSTEHQIGALNVSLDCGTAKTFERMKGMDKFEDVKNNLIKYGSNRVKEKEYELKYIFCEGYNDNKKDILGFIEIAKQANVTKVMMDRNFHDIQKPLSEHMKEMCKYFCETASRFGIRNIIRQQFSDKDIKYFSSYTQNK